MTVDDLLLVYSMLQPRKGPTATVPLFFLDEYTWFENVGIEVGV